MKALKISALALAFAGLTFAAKAQTKSVTPLNGIKLSIAADAGLPIGDFSDSHKWSIGGNVQAEFPVADQLAVTFNAGYNNIFGKTVNVPVLGEVKATEVKFLPIKAGLKYYAVGNLYIQGEAGASFLLNKDDLSSDKSVAFAYAPQVGYVFPLGGKSYLDAGVRFEGTSKIYDAGKSLNTIGLRVAYAFGL